MNRLRRNNRPAYQEVVRFLEGLQRWPWPVNAEALREPWDGCYGVHVGRDRYRVIWEVDSEIQTVFVLRVGPKERRGGGTIYDDPRPSRG
ncbi:MAG: type II toxin-antitoxin system RelE family toxin [Thermoleophilaceae bacterium]